jgi:hypothetical protein
MGYQLWTSPITGYRRKGTRLADLRSVVGARIVTRTIQEPLQCCPSDAPADDMRRILGERGFDVAGVQTNHNGPVVGFVVTETLQGGSVKDHTSPMSVDHLISDATPLSDLLAVLREKERVFVLAGSGVQGIVTRADLNKPPVRVYLFGLLSLLEMHMQFWVRRAYGEESWKEKLKDDRLQAAETIQDERRGRNEHITVLDCLQFCDKRDLLLASNDLRAKLGLASKRQAKSLFNGAEDLRNRLAHSQQDLVQGSSWKAQIELIEKVEELVHRSDDTVEQEAKSARKSVDELWVAPQKGR